MNVKHTVFLGLWDNYDKGALERIEQVEKVIQAVEEFGTIAVSFAYNGRTRHETASYVMKDMLPTHYKTVIGYNYEFIISKEDGAHE